MDPWTTYWWHQFVSNHSPRSPANPQLVFTPVGSTVPLPGYWEANAWKPQWVPQIIPGTHQLGTWDSVTSGGIDAYRTRAVDGFRSRKYPELHPTLAIDTSLIRYDVRFQPQDGIAHGAYPANRVSFALARVRLRRLLPSLLVLIIRSSSSQPRRFG